MNFTVGSGFSKLTGKVEKLLGDDVGLQKGLSGCDMAIGLATDPKFGVPAHAMDSPILMGDSEYAGEKLINPAVEAMMKQNPDKVQVHPKFNPNTQKFDMKFAMAGDADFDPIAGQLFSPWNIAFLNKIWKQPLSYSRAKEMIKTERTGNNPFAEIFTLFLEEYAGWGAIGQTGDFQNQMANDVNVKNGIMSAPIINMMGTYSLTLEEKRRSTWGPAGQSPLSRKQSYLNYVMDMMEAILIYYGNDETNTLGLLDINPIRMWATGKSTADIYNGTSTTRGSDMFRLLAGQVNDFLTSSDNKFQKIKIAMSPEAFNNLTSMPYSDQFNPETAMQTFAKSYLAGKGPNGTTPTIEFVPEPLLKANSELNPNPYDYMVMTCPEIDGGPDKTPQATNFFAKTLDKFVFPVIPGMYNDQYKTLRRTAGVFAPIPSAVRVFAGFGTQGN